MPEYINYFEDDLPALYTIHPGEKDTVLIVSAHADFLSFLKDITSDTKKPYFRMIADELKIGPLNGFSDISKPWGFGDVFVPSASETKDWTSWACSLPNNRDSFWLEGAKLSASLGLFTYLARAYLDNSRTSSTFPQTFLVDLETEREGRNIWVDLTKDAVKWVAEQEETEKQPEIIHSMINAYQFMMGREIRRGELFSAKIRKPYWINLQVPGDRVGLDPLRYAVPSDDEGKPFLKGYRLLPHNVDSSLQQLTLLMGLAALGKAVLRRQISGSLGN